MPLKWIPRSKPGASKSRPRWAAHTRIGNVWGTPRAQYQPLVPRLEQILMKNWHLIEQQPLLSEIYKKPPLVSYKRGRSVKDILVRAKL